MQSHKIKNSVENIRTGANKAIRTEILPASVSRFRSVFFQFSLLLIAIAFAVLVFLVTTITFIPIDLKITRGIQSINIPLFGGLMNVVSWIGFIPQSMIITGLIVLVIYGFGLHWEAVMGIIAALLSTTINILVKDIIQRPRPTASLVHVLDVLNSYSFPSGHVMFFTGFFGFICFLAFSLLKPSIKRTLVILFFGSLISLIGISRVYVGEHWASDVIGAYLLGTLTLTAIIQCYRWGKTRFFVHQPATKTVEVAMDAHPAEKALVFNKPKKR